MRPCSWIACSKKSRYSCSPVFTLTGTSALLAVYRTGGASSGRCQKRNTHESFDRRLRKLFTAAAALALFVIGWRHSGSRRQAQSTYLINDHRRATANPIKAFLIYSAADGGRAD